MAAVILLVVLAVLALPGASAAQDGAALYKELCSSCHDTAVDRAPSREALRAMSPQRVLDAMEAGPMVAMTQLRSAAERRAIAEFASGRRFGTAFSIAPAPKAMCTAGRGPFSMTPASPAWNGFGQNASNTRFQAVPGAGLSAAEVPKLKVKWAFGLPGDVQSWAGLTLAGGRLFFGSIAGNVYSLDAKTGCVHWAFDAGAIVRTAVSVGPIGAAGRYGAFFGDARGNAYALDAETGALVWKVAAETYPSARLTGSPILHEGRLYVPVSSSEEGVGSLTDYECCKFRGSIVALDAATGRQIWKTYTIPDEPRPVRKNARGVQLWGPSGAPIWSSPVVDPVRRALYVTTGNNYSDPPTGDERRVHGDGPRHGPHPVDTPGARPRRLRIGLPPRGQDELSRRQGARLRLRGLADSRRRSATAAARSSPGTSRATSTPSIRIARGRGCGRRASARAGRWAACSGARPPTPATSTWRCRTSAASCSATRSSPTPIARAAAACSRCASPTAPASGTRRRRRATRGRAAAPPSRGR